MMVILDEKYYLCEAPESVGIKSTVRNGFATIDQRSGVIKLGVLYVPAVAAPKDGDVSGWKVAVAAEHTAAPWLQRKYPDPIKPNRWVVRVPLTEILWTEIP